MSRQRVGGLLRALLVRNALAASPAAQPACQSAALISVAWGLGQAWGGQAPPPFRHAAAAQQRRAYSEDLHTGLLTQLSETKYHRVADHTLEELLEKLEAYVEDLDLDGDVEYSQGVLTLKLGSLGTYVINKQSPNRQIWMSSPVSGPVRYDYMSGRWVYHRDGHTMRERLEQELAGLTGAALDLGQEEEDAEES